MQINWKPWGNYLPRTHCIETHTYGIILISPLDEILVVKGRYSNKWGFPKGHGNTHEKPLDAALRELKEEAGINLDGYKPVSQKLLKRNSGRIGGTYFIFYLDFKPDINIQDTNEISQAMWCHKDRLSQLKANMDLNTFCYKKLYLDPEFTNLKNI
jgi:8-oxo-dGTP pyrophosphatase MutT (NUDIX family)